MRQLPNEATMLEALQAAREMEQAARKMSEMATSIAYECQKSLSEFRKAATQSQDISENAYVEEHFRTLQENS